MWGWTTYNPARLATPPAASVPEPTAARYVEVLDELAAAAVSGWPARCWSWPPILCAGCAQPFEPEDDRPG